MKMRRKPINGIVSSNKKTGIRIPDFFHDGPMNTHSFEAPGLYRTTFFLQLDFLQQVKIGIFPGIAPLDGHQIPMIPRRLKTSGLIFICLLYTSDAADEL